MALSKPTDETRMQIEQTLSCPVCLQFFTQPKSLDCGHTFCQDCIEQNVRQSRDRRAEYPCPVCRSGTRISDIPDALPDNVTVMQMIDIYQDTSALCTICIHLNKRVSATSCCFQCGQLVCDECTEKHSALKSCENHFVMPLEDEHLSVKCKVHVNEMYKTFCMQCQQFLCQVCVLTGHNEHVLTSIEEAIETWKKLSSDNLPSTEKLLDTAEAEVLNLKSIKDAEEEAHATMTKTLHDQSNLLQKLVSHQFLQAGRALDHQASARQSQLQNKIDHLESTLEECREEHASAKECSTICQIMCAIRAGVDTVGNLSKMTKLAEDINPQEVVRNPEFIATPDSSLIFGRISLGTDGEFIDLSKLAEDYGQQDPAEDVEVPDDSDDTDDTEEQEAKSTSLHFCVEDIWNKRSVQTGGVAFRDCWWSLLAQSTLSNEMQKDLGLFVVCKPICQLNSSWQCHAKAKMSLLGNGENFDRGIEHIFTEKQNDWGFKKFADNKVISDKRFVKDGSFQVRIDMEADQLTYTDN